MAQFYSGETGGYYPRQSVVRGECLDADAKRRCPRNAIKKKAVQYYYDELDKAVFIGLLDAERREEMQMSSLSSRTNRGDATTSETTQGKLANRE